MWKRIGTAVAAGALVAAALGTAAAATPVDTIETAPTVDHAVAVDDGFASSEMSFTGSDLSEEDISEINAETDALVAHLEGLGFDVSVETDSHGIRYPAFDDDADDGVYEAIDAYYEAMFAEEVASWSVEEKAEWSSWTDEFIADLAAEGITVDKVEIAPGVYDIEWTEELEATLMDVNSSFFDGDYDAEFEDGFPEWELSDAEMADINAETDALVVHLERLGFHVTVETDSDGVRYPAIDDDADDGIFEAIDAYYEAMFAEEVASWSVEEKAEWNRWTDEFITDLAAQGITVDKIEIAPGVYDIEWTEEFDMSPMEFDGPFFEDEAA